MSAARAEVWPWRAPLDPPVQTASGRHAERAGGWVRLAAEGLVGWGEIAPWPGFGAGPAAVAAWLAEPAGPPPPEVRAGVAFARADLEARRRGCALATRWGAPGAEALPSHVPGDGPPWATRKLKVGAAALAEDRARVAAARAAWPEAPLRLDANGVWSLAEAERALPALAEAGATVLEQPLARGAALADWRRLRRQAEALGLRIELDESLGDAAFTSPEAWAEAAHGVVLKPSLMGGPEPARRAARAAARLGLARCLTHAFEGAVGRLGVLHLAAALRAEDPGLTLGLEGAVPGPGAAAVAAARLGPGRWVAPPGPGLGWAPEVPEVGSQPLDLTAFFGEEAEA